MPSAVARLASELTEEKVRSALDRIAGGQPSATARARCPCPARQEARQAHSQAALRRQAQRQARRSPGREGSRQGRHASSAGNRQSQAQAARPDNPPRRQTAQAASTGRA